MVYWPCQLEFRLLLRKRGVEYMKAVGLVVEYNPFHNGHLYHLQSAKQLADADVVIAVMSGNFLQRGEMAIVDKWARARVALQSGVDIVIELPPTLSVQRADLFADAAVQILHAIGCESLVFGSESGEIEQFAMIANAVATNKDAYDQLVREQMTTGISYPSAAGNAMRLISNQMQLNAYTSARLDLSSPNNNLGYHYVASILKHQFAIEPLTITRKGAAYHAVQAESGFASATSIRKSIFEHGDELTTYAPAVMNEAICTYLGIYGALHHWEAYWPLLQYKLQSSSPKQLARMYEMREGIEHRFLHTVRTATSFTTFIEQVKTKRYSWARLGRLSTYLLLNMEAEMMVKHQSPTYLRLLGATQIGRDYLQRNKRQFLYPMISKASDGKSDCFQENLRFNQVYYSIFSNKLQSLALKSEFAAPIMI